MTREQWSRRVELAVLAGVVAGVAVAIGAPPLGTLRVLLYVCVAIAVEAAVRLVVTAVGEPRSSVFAAVATPRRPEPDTTPVTLETLQRGVWLAVGSIGGWHFRLRPRLREITAALLEDRHRVDLDHDPAAAGILGPEAWELLRPDVVEPPDRFAEGLQPPEMEDLVRRIERL